MIDLAAGELRDDLVNQSPERSQTDSLKANRQNSRAKLLAADPRVVHDERGTVIVVLEQRAGGERVDLAAAFERYLRRRCSLRRPGLARDPLRDAASCVKGRDHTPTAV
jgi:hypothetical protein